MKELDRIDYSVIEERIKKLEMLLIVPFKHSWETKDFSDAVNQIPIIQISKDIESQLFEENRDYLIDLRFAKIPSSATLVTEDYFRGCANQFWPLKCILYSGGALYATSEQIPAGLINRLEMSTLYLEKALTFNFCTQNDPVTVLTLSQIGTQLVRLDKPDSYLYFKMAIKYAKMLGINSEDGIAKISPFDYERENIRRIWWFLYSIFALSTQKFEDEAIKDSDCQLFLPSDNINFRFNSIEDYQGKELMASTEWYTHCIPNQSVLAYKIILHRIQIKLHKYVLLFLRKESDEIEYIAGALDGSLRGWYDCTIGIFNSCVYQIKTRQMQQEEHCWLALTTYLMYNCVRIELINPRFMHCIMKDKPVDKILHIREAITAALNNTQLLELIESYNPNFQYISPLIIALIYRSAFFVQCIMRIPELEKDYYVRAYEKHLQLFQLYEKSFQRKAVFYKLLKHTEDLDLYSAILFFGELKANNRLLSLEKPKSDPAKMFAKLSLSS
ncbi:hypothetical protein HK103_002469 [Boothiomyces macroporosus]|uniref:Transcription factor domain-containing protein n=1 Tax=Boothiomyces macroporosus TaxID=261099 RepID=A0AAD5UD35_9FUNG|nr:hypothetical protein HK103_002469 [Boothiomyces macroporosus]